MGQQTNWHLEVGGKGILFSFTYLTPHLQLTLHTINAAVLLNNVAATKKELILFKHS